MRARLPPDTPEPRLLQKPFIGIEKRRSYSIAASRSLLPGLKVLPVWPGRLAGKQPKVRPSRAPRCPPWKDPEESGKIPHGGCSHQLVINRGEVNKTIPACQPQGRLGIAMTANSETRVPKLVSGLSIFF